MVIPEPIPNWIAGDQDLSSSENRFKKINPADGKYLHEVIRSNADDVASAVSAATQAQNDWAEKTAVQRGMILHDLVQLMDKYKVELAECIAKETGRSLKDARAEVTGAINLGLFFCGEGQRLEGRTIASGVSNRHSIIIRQAVGVAALIVSANTPIANIAWKVFPALICGNAVVLKAAEDAPAIAWCFGWLAHETGLPPGVINIIQGYGPEAGSMLTKHKEVGVISFTGSREVGYLVLAAAAPRMARVSLELGGKNPLVVCDDADINQAVHWALLSAFSLAGQRCAAASRIIIFNSVYDRFRELFIEAAGKLKVGLSDTDDFGPLITKRALEKVQNNIEIAKEAGAVVTGGNILKGASYEGGYYMEPAVIEGLPNSHEVSRTELFGPVTNLYKADNFRDALRLTNDSPFGLTAAVHTKNLDRALRFSQLAQAGMVMINAGTFGSEPHMPFGGLKESGNGTREPGIEALDVYSNKKNIVVNINTEIC